MKIKLVLISFFLFTLNSFAQRGKGSLCLGYNFEVDYSFYDKYRGNEISIGNIPNISYYFLNYFEIGVLFSKMTNNQTTIGSYLRHHYPFDAKCGSYIGIGFSSFINQNPNYSSKMKSNIEFGFEYFIKQRLGINFNMNLIGFTKERKSSENSYYSYFTASVGIKYNLIFKADIEKIWTQDNTSSGSTSKSNDKKQNTNNELAFVPTETSADGFLKSVYDLALNVQNSKMNLDEIKLLMYGLLTNPNDYVGKELNFVISDFKNKGIKSETIDKASLQTASAEKKSKFKDIDLEKLKINSDSILNKLESIGLNIEQIPQNTIKLLDEAKQLPDKLKGELKGKQAMKIPKVLKQVKQSSDNIGGIVINVPVIITNITDLVPVIFDILDFVDLNRKPDNKFFPTNTAADGFLKSAFDLGVLFNSINENIDDLKIFTYGLLSKPKEYIGKELNIVVSEEKKNGIKADSIDFDKIKNLATKNKTILKQSDILGLKNSLSSIQSKLKEMEPQLSQIPDNAKKSFEEALALPEKLKTEFKGFKLITKFPRVLKGIDNAKTNLTPITTETPKLIANLTGFMAAITSILSTLK